MLLLRTCHLNLTLLLNYTFELHDLLFSKIPLGDAHLHVSENTLYIFFSSKFTTTQAICKKVYTEWNVKLAHLHVKLLCHLLYPKRLKFGLQAYFSNMFAHAKFQLTIIFKLRFLFVNPFVWSWGVLSIQLFISLDTILNEREIGSWNFACPEILKKYAWRPNFILIGRRTKVLGEQCDVQNC